MKLIPARHFVVITLVLSALLSSACTTPLNRAEQLAQGAGFSKAVIPGKDFEHIVYEHDLDAYPLKELHIYIDGDGTPWVAGRYPSADPTPGRAMALEMMAEDPAPAIYLGRPCYFGLASSANCSVELWTSRRYSPEVVVSMLSVIGYYQQTYGVRKIVLIGYSGGGTLAALLARDLQQPLFLVTVAANLDIDLWTELRGFLPLKGSLNPLHYRDDMAQIAQLHLAGEQDNVVPIAVTESYTAGLETQFFRYYPTFDHTCCWLALWPDILAEKPWSEIGNE